MISVYQGYDTNSGINITRKYLSVINKCIRTSYICLFHYISCDDKIQWTLVNDLNCIRSLLMAYKIGGLWLSLNDVNNKLHFANHDANSVAHHHGIRYVVISEGSV